MKYFLLISIFCSSVGLFSADSFSYIKFTKYSGSFSLLGQEIDETVQSGDGFLDTYQQQSYRTDLELFLDGYVIHPNFITFNIGGGYILDKGDVERTAIPSDYDLSGNNYLVSIRVLPKKKVNFELYAKELLSSSQRRFVGNIISKYSTIGFKIYSRTKILPFKLDTYSTKNISKVVGVLNRNEAMGRVELDMNLFDSGHANARLAYDYTDFSESVFGVSYERSRIDLRFNYKYGKDERNLLYSTLRRNTMQGSLEIDNLSLFLNNRLRIKNNVTFGSTYTLNKNSSDTTGLTQHTLINDINHQLYDSLYTSLRLMVEKYDSPQQKVTRLQPNLSFRYRKKIPTGDLMITHNEGFINEDHQSLNDLSNGQELLSFSFSDQIVLSYTGIQWGSIRITDEGLSTVYIEGLDYDLIETDGLVTIVRLPEGDIPIEGKIFVHFTYLSLPDFSAHSPTNSTYLRVNFLKYYSVFYGYGKKTNDIESNFLVVPFNRFKKENYGIGITTDYVKAKYQKEDLNTNFTDQRSTSWDISISKRFFQKLLISGFYQDRETYISEQDFTNQFSTSQFLAIFNVKANLKMKASLRHNFYETISQRRERDTAYLLVNWQFRLFELSMQYETILYQANSEDRSRDLFYVKVRRRF